MKTVAPEHPATGKKLLGFFSQSPLRAILLAGVFLLSQPACSPRPYQASNRVYRKQARADAKILRGRPQTPDSIPVADQWVGTTNFSMRRPNYVIIHHTAQQNMEQTLRTFTTPRAEVSAHYVIGRDGTVYHMLNDYLRAHQAGVSKWGNTTDLNSASIGIELDNDGFEFFPEEQISSLLKLLDHLKKAYRIPTANFLGHGDNAPTRKDDPNWRFPWKLLAEKGFGYWYGDTSGIRVPASFEPVLALRVLGYDVKDSSAAMQAFRRHWMQDSTSHWTPESSQILYTLLNQYR